MGCFVWLWGWWFFGGLVVFFFYLKFTLMDSNLEEQHATSLEHLLHFSELADIS